MNKYFRTASLLLLSLIAVTSCMKDPLDKIRNINGLRWKGDYAAALVNAELNLEDVVELVDNEWVNSSLDKTLVVHYDQKHYSKSGESLLAIMDRNFTGSVVPTAGELNVLSNSGFVSLVRNFVFDIAPGSGIQFDSMLLKDGFFNAGVVATTAHQGKVYVEFPDLKSQKKQVVLTENWTGGGSISRSPFHKVSGIESLDLTKGNLGYNQIRVKVTWEITKSGAVGNNEQLQLNLSTQGLKFRRINGFMGQPALLDVKDSLDLTLFSNDALKGNIVFEDARIKLHFNNGNGLASRYQIQQLSLISGNGTAVPVTAYNNTGIIPAAPLGAAESRITDSVYITQASGSNVATVMKTEPDYLAYDVKITPELGRGYLWDSSNIILTVTVELPLFVYAKDFVLEDTSNLNLGIGDEGKYVEMIKFKVDAENGIPLGLSVQCYFMDAGNLVLDSLFQPFRYFVKQAQVDAGGIVQTPSKDQWELVVEKPRITNILKATKLRTRAWIPTSSFNGNPVPVRITADQKLKLKMGAEVKLSADAKL